MNNEVVVRPIDKLNNQTVVSHSRDIIAKFSPVDPRCEAIAVIPVHREFEGGRLVQLLTELEGQDVPNEQLEVILVVNNRPLSIEDNNEARLDNLNFLKYFEAARQEGHFSRVRVIDATDGQIPARHMGLIRGLGQLVAEDRLIRTEKGEKGIIIQLDADVAVSPDFVSGLLQAYENPTIKAAIVGRIPLAIDFKSDDYYVAFSRQFAYGVATIADGQGSIHTDGATISFRASAHREQGVRRYMNLAYSEDFGIGEALSKSGGMYTLVEPRVYKGDRVRPEGFDSASRHIWAQCSLSSSRVHLLSHLAFGNGHFSREQFESVPTTQYWQSYTRKLEKSDPAAGRKLCDALTREEVLARQHMDWDNLNPHLRTTGLFLFALSRIAMGEKPLLVFPPGVVYHGPGGPVYSKVIYPLDNTTMGVI